MDALVAGTLAHSGAAHELLNLWREGVFELATCPELIREFIEVMGRPRIAGRYGITHEEINQAAEELETEGLGYPDNADPPRRVPGDLDDDYLADLAVRAEAMYLVSRDRHFHAAGLENEDVEVIYPAGFLRLLRELEDTS